MTRILILDDEPELASMLGKLLELAGYDCICTRDGYAALEIIRREPVDLIIQDCLRVTPNGFDLYEILKANQSWRRIPVLFFSAAITPKETAEMRAPYADKHVQKPARTKELLAVIMPLLRESGKHVPTAEERRARYPQLQTNWPNSWTIEFKKKYQAIVSWLTEGGA